ncbi:hypothetical protein SO802_024059 [Lithocarpus litseifolius]|uniref:Uncharacterized protein n=1 Tax=Lithocarpus litseifolius TaxID=425828 RepID=A0AAW2C816_9ROSI
MNRAVQPQFKQPAKSGSSSQLNPKNSENAVGRSRTLAGSLCNFKKNWELKGTFGKVLGVRFYRVVSVLQPPEGDM